MTLQHRASPPLFIKCQCTRQTEKPHVKNDRASVILSLKDFTSWRPESTSNFSSTLSGFTSHAGISSLKWIPEMLIQVPTNLPPHRTMY